MDLHLFQTEQDAYITKTIHELGARARRRLFWFCEIVKRVWNHIERENARAIEIHNRAQVVLDKRHEQNWYTIR